VKTTGLRARILYLRMRPMQWMLIVLGVAVWLAFFLFAGEDGSGARAEGALMAWSLMGMVLLWFYGIALAVATVAMMRPGHALVPGAYRILWRTSGARGLFAIAVMLVSILVFAASGARPPNSAGLWLAGASLSLASGFASVFAVSHHVGHHRGRAVFMVLALLPLTAWQLTRAVDLPSPWWLSLWALAWPACAWQLARVMRSIASGLLLTSGTRTQAPSMVGSFSERWLRRGLNGHQADSRCLMREPWQRHDWAILFALCCTAAVLGWDRDYSSQTLLLQCYTLLAATALRPMAMLEAGLRPRLLLLPGGVARPDLGWTMFCECLRSWSRAAGIVVLIGAIGVSMMGGQDMALRGVSAGLVLAGMVVLNMGASIALQGWVANRGRRATIQLLAGVGLAMACAGGVLNVTDLARPATGAMLWSALALGLLQTSIGVAFVLASARAWSRFDWVRFRSAQRARGNFDPTPPR
jgi:hypothetical protein